jgi:hypothetical protein
MPWAKKTLLAAILVTTSCLLNTAVSQSTGYSDFSMDEFFDIKRTIGRLKVRKTARALVAARSAVKLLQLTAPQKLVFHGQDHYQQTFDDTGKESWFHVGRPVRFLRSLLPCPRSSGPTLLFFGCEHTHTHAPCISCCGTAVFVLLCTWSRRHSNLADQCYDQAPNVRLYSLMRVLLFFIRCFFE